MIKGLFTSASGMLPQVKKHEISANNLANAGTPGFKKDVLFTKELSKAEIKVSARKSDWQTPMVDRIYVDHAPGPFDKTGNPLHLAIDGDGFFSLQLEDGTVAITRSGSFTVNADGLLAAPGGALLLGEGGPLEVGSGSISVASTGEVQSNGITVGRIAVMTVNDFDRLEKIGSAAFAVPDDLELVEVKRASIQQGYLEESNVDVVREMIDMMIAFRTYEANAKAVQTQDQSLEHLFRRVAGRT